MDLAYLIQNYAQRPPGNMICLYIVQQNDMPSKFKDVYRCGAAGIKESLDVDRPYGSAGGNLVSRMVRYLNNWINGGKIFACLTVPRSLFLGYSEKVVIDDGSNRPAYAKAGKTRVQIREREFHDEIVKRGGSRFKSDRSEWFKGTKRQLFGALRTIGGGDFYEFTGNTTDVTHERLKSNQKEDDIMRVEHRKSPRLVEVSMSTKDVEALRRGDERSRRIARALAQLM